MVQRRLVLWLGGRARRIGAGVAELITYLSLKDSTFGLVFDERHAEQVSWQEPDGRERRVTMPRVTFVRSAP